MAQPGVTGPAPGPAADQILAGWLDRLDAALPAPARLRRQIVTELQDGLRCATEHHLTAGAAPGDAVQAAIAEFGDPDTVAASFRGELTARLARRTGIVLVASGPLVGLIWLAALVPPLWPPRPADLLSAHPLYLGVLAVAVPAALLAIAVTGPFGRRLPHEHRHAARAAALAATACAAGDALLLATLADVALSTPIALTWPTALLAAAASTTRLGGASRAAHRCIAGGLVRIAIDR